MDLNKEEISSSQLLKHIEVLSERYPHRHTGEPQERKVVEYIRDMMYNYGLETHTYTIPVMGWEVKSLPTLQIIEPKKRRMECAPVVYSKSTPAEGVRGGLKFKGKTLLSGFVAAEKYAIIDNLSSTIKGYLAGRLEGPAVAYGSVTDEINGHNFSINSPVCIVGNQDLKLIKQWEEQGLRIKLRYSIQTIFKDKCNSFVVQGIKKGRTDQIVIVGAHHDTQGATGFPECLDSPGANDNASGVGSLLELARVFAKKQTNRTIFFCTFGGEEWGLLTSTEYVRLLEEKGELKKIIYCMILDQTANGEDLELEYSSDSPNLISMFTSKTKLNSGFQINQSLINRPGSDYWPFKLAGIQCCSIGWSSTEFHYHRRGDNLQYCREGQEKYILSTEIARQVLATIATGVK